MLRIVGVLSPKYVLPYFVLLVGIISFAFFENSLLISGVFVFLLQFTDLKKVLILIFINE